VVAPRGGSRGLCPCCKPLCLIRAPAGKPLSLQHQLFALHSTSVPFCTPTEANFLALTRRQDFESKFSGGDTMARFVGGVCHILYPPAAWSSAVCGAQTFHCCWDSDYRAPLEVTVPHLCPSKNKLQVPPLKKRDEGIYRREGERKSGLGRKRKQGRKMDGKVAAPHS